MSTASFSNTAQCKQGGEQWQQGSGLAKDMEYNKIIKPKVIIWCNVQSGVVFRTHIDPNSGATGGGTKKRKIGISDYFNFGHIP